MYERLAAVLALLVLAGGCAGRGIGPGTCEIEILGAPQVRSAAGGVDVEIRVRGRAGSSAVTWLAARRGPGDYVSGKGVELAPGPFQAAVELPLTAPARSYAVVLELADGKRCRDTT